MSRQGAQQSEDWAARRETGRSSRQRRAQALAAVCAVLGTLLLAGTVTRGDDGPSSQRASVARAPIPKPARARPPTPSVAAPGARARRRTPRAEPGTETVPILMYHVIARPIPRAPYPGLYVPSAEFAAQMQALKRAGYHAVTLDQVRSYWRRGTPLPRKPIVLSFDNGYRTQFTRALPILRRLHWVGDENLQLTGLPPSQGGLSAREVRLLVAAGWELDTQGISHADLTTLDASALRYQVATARRLIQQRYHVAANWFCYPSGRYDPTVVEAVKAAGYVGSTTVVPGWAGPGEDPFRLPRLRVLGGTSPAELLALIAGTREDGPAPTSYLPGG